MKSNEIWQKITENARLRNMEINGFIRGEKKGKTMDVSQSELYRSLEKQWKDLHDGYLCCASDRKVMRYLADLRNVAGCLFIKLEEKNHA